MGLEAIAGAGSLSKGQKRVLEILKGQTLVGLNKYEEALEIADKCIAAYDPTSDPLHAVDTILMKASAMAMRKKHNETNKLISRADSLLHSHAMMQPWWEKLLVQGVVEHRTAIDAIPRTPGQKSITIEHAEYADRLASLCLMKGNAELWKGKSDKAVGIWKRGLAVSEKLEHAESALRLLHALAEQAWDSGRKPESIDYMDRYFDFAETAGSKITLAKAYEVQGSRLQEVGDIGRAGAHLQNALALAEIMEDTSVIQGALDALGASCYSKGEILEALEYWQKCASLETKNDDRTTARDLYRFGMIEQAHGNYEIALRHYQRSVEMLKALNEDALLHKVLIRLIPLTLELGDLTGAKLYIERVQDISARAPGKLSWEQAVRLFKALLLKHSARASGKFGAQLLLRKITEEQIANHEITAIAMVNLCESLLLELQLFGEEEVLIEVKLLSAEIMEFARETGSVTLLIQAYILHAEIALLEPDTDRALAILNEAQDLAEEKGLTKWARTVSRKFDSLLDQVQAWEALGQKGTTVNQRLKNADLDTLIERMRTLSFEEIPDLPDEEPVMLMVMHESGLGLYSKAFMETTVSEQLLAALLTAINSLSQEAFQSSGSIERIKHQNYTLLMKPEGTVVFCYVFKGQSYSAIEKLSDFMAKIVRSASVWEKFSAVVPEIDQYTQRYVDMAAIEAFEEAIT